MAGQVQTPKRIHAGFTLMELLLAVAIVVALAAVTAPSLAQIARGQEMNRLDNYAKEIYVALQDQLIGMESSGEYSQFNDAVAAASQRNLGTLGVQPTDAEGTGWRGFYYLVGPESPDGSAADAALAQVMARTPVVDGLTKGSRYIVEVSPRADGTDVYSVFYSEDPAFSYADVMALPSRERAERMDTGRGYAIGYYCATSAEGGGIPTHFAPRATLVNGEELFLKVTCPAGMAFAGLESGMKVKVVLACGSASEEIELAGGTDFTLNSAGNIDLDIVLDSMRDGMHLAEIFPSFEPGADITATVEVTYTRDGNTIATPAALRGQAKANSLFAKNSSGAIEVANVRHLSNLHLMDDGISRVTQVNDIDFNADEWGSSETTELSSATKSYNRQTYGADYVNPLDPNVVSGARGFVPISPSASAKWPYYGQGNTLNRFVIDAQGDAGLFAHVRAGQTVSRATMVDPTVSGTGNTGALAGVLSGTVDGCGVRLNVLEKADSGKEFIYTVSSTGSVAGGLVGAARDGASIANSYAAIHVAAPNASAAGGLVGQFASTASISKSYSSCEVEASGAVGGLVGLFESGTVSGSYSTADVSSAGTAGGLLGQASGGSVSDSVSYGQVSGDSCGGFVGGGSATFSGCIYLSQAGYNDNLTAQPAGIEARDYAALATGGLAEDHSFPYRDDLFGTAFPFAPALEEHWGNWPKLAGADLTLLYYEKYSDESYGFYAEGIIDGQQATLSTLDEALAVVEDGYALMSPTALRGLSYALNGGAQTRLSRADAAGDGSFVELDAGTLEYYDGSGHQELSGMHVYQLPLALQMPDRQAGRLFDELKITLGDSGASSTTDYTFYYNPDFAKTAHNPDADGGNSEPSDETMLLRSARQLNRLGYQGGYWGESIAQDRDIDFGYYTRDYLGLAIDYSSTSGAYANTPIGTASSPFTGSFDGRNNVIVDYEVLTDGASFAGLFGRIDGAVRNVHLSASRLGIASVTRAGGASASSTAGVGALAGSVVGGTVSGCSVSGYEVYYTGSAPADAVAGGLVGLNSGTVQQSAAANTYVVIQASSGSGAVLGAGGLVGGNSGSIVQSYAVENTYTISTSTSGSSRSIAYGGIAGYAYSGASGISDCYAYGFAVGTVCAAADSVGNFAISPGTQPISNCYALEVGEATDDGAGVSVCDPGQLQNASLAGFAGGTEPRWTYGETMAGHVVQNSMNYPYPVVCKDVDGDWAHYGFDWRE